MNAITGKKKTKTKKIQNGSVSKFKPLPPPPKYLQPLKTPFDTKLIISAKAELKIKIAMSYSKSNEIMWFGELKKNKKEQFILKDVLFPPQEVQAAFVTTKDDEFPAWFFKYIIKTGKAKKMRLHGHTHPYFDTTPSSVDIAHVTTYLKETNTFFIQLILSNYYKPSCILYTMEGYQRLEVDMEQSRKLNKILEKVTHKKDVFATYGYNKARGLLHTEFEEECDDDFSYYRDGRPWV